MKRLVTLFAATLAIALSVLPAAAQSETVVAGAGEGIFPSGAVLYGVPLNGLQFAKGITIGASGSATGQFPALLLGTSLLGQPQNINVQGKAGSGPVKADWRATFGGGGTAERAARPISGRADAPSRTLRSEERVELADEGRWVVQDEVVVGPADLNECRRRDRGLHPLGQVAREDRAQLSAHDQRGRHDPPEQIGRAHV